MLKRYLERRRLKQNLRSTLNARWDEINQAHNAFKQDYSDYGIYIPGFESEKIAKACHHKYLDLWSEYEQLQNLISDDPDNASHKLSSFTFSSIKEYHEELRSLHANQTRSASA